MTWIHFSAIFLLSLVLQVLLALPRAFSLDWASPLGFIGGFLGALGLLHYSVRRKEAKPTYVFLVLLLGFCALDAYPRLAYFSKTLISLPDFVMRLLGLTTAYLYFRTKQWWPALVGLVLGCFMLFSGVNYWLHWLSYGSFTGQSAEVLDKPLVFYDAKDDTIRSQDWQGKLVVLDFWHSRCGVCFVKFPSLQDLYQQYREDPQVEVYAVNSPLRQDTARQAFEMIRQRRHDFPVLMPLDSNLAEQLGVAVYPTVLVVSDAGLIVHRGSLDGVPGLIRRWKKQQGG